MSRLLVILFFLIIWHTDCKLVPSYYLQKHYDLQKQMCKHCPMECLYTKKEDVLSLPRTITMCYRVYPMLYEHDTYFYSHAVAFGNINRNFTFVEEGMVSIEWDILSFFVKDFDYESKLCCFLKVIPLDEVFKQSLTQHELEFYTRSAQLITIKFQGFLYGMWLTGPWLGYKTKESPTFAWVGLGEHLNPAVQVWRHTCVR